MGERDNLGRWRVGDLEGREKWEEIREAVSGTGGARRELQRVKKLNKYMYHGMKKWK